MRTVDSKRSTVHPQHVKPEKNVLAFQPAEILQYIASQMKLADHMVDKNLLMAHHPSMLNGRSCSPSNVNPVMQPTMIGLPQLWKHIRKTSGLVAVGLVML